jgi:hypothetical protein
MLDPVLPDAAGVCGPLRPGQLVLRRRDGRVVEVVAHDPARGLVLLADGARCREDEVEDPLRQGPRRDLARGRAARRFESAVAVATWADVAWSLVVVSFLLTLLFLSLGG